MRRKEYQLHPLGEKGYSRISQAIAPKNYHSGNLGEAIVRYLKFTHTHTCKNALEYLQFMIVVLI